MNEISTVQLLLMLCLPGCDADVPTSRAADLVLLDTDVLTMNPAQPQARRYQHGGSGRPH